MKATALKKKFDSINKAIGTQIDKLYDLADEFYGEEVQEMITEYADKLTELVTSDENPDTSAVAISDYIENEMIPNEANFYSEDE